MHAFFCGTACQALKSTVDFTRQSVSADLVFLPSCSAEFNSGVFPKRRIPAICKS